MIICLENQYFQLLSERALLWQEKNILILADIHLGKVATFQKSGIPVPEGTMDADLKRLTELIDRYQIKECIVVGDLIHGKLGLTSLVRQKIADWLNTIPCIIHLVAGNHDGALLKDLPQRWNIKIHPQHLLMEPFCFQHLPEPHHSYFVFAGHIHPQYVIKAGFDRIRLPCFWIQNKRLVLPAFGEFTGGITIKKEKDSTIYVIAEHMIFKV